MTSDERLQFKTLFAVHLSCNSCVDDISATLSKIQGISKINCDIKSQLCEVEGSAAPSEIVEAIQSTGRDAILRGSGEANSAAVCILETHAPNVSHPIRGLARLVQVGSSLTLVDLSVQGHEEGTYVATLQQCGDISRGAASTGGVWEGDEGSGKQSGILGKVLVGITGKGSTLIDSPVPISKLVGRAMVVSKAENFGRGDDDKSTIVGVIARSAGVWENQKTVCSCSGKTVWEERKEQVGRGMM